MSLEHRKTKIINPSFQYRIAFTAVLVAVIGINLFVLLASLLPEVVGLELVLSKRSYYVIAITEVALIYLCWKWSIFATHRVAGPVYAIGRELCKLRDGDLMINISLRPRDEFRETSEMINSSIAHLRDKINEIKSMVSELDAEPSAEKIGALKNSLNALKTHDEGGTVAGKGSGEK